MAPSRVRIPPSPLARRRGRAHPRRGGRAVECGGLENRYPCKRIGGSNPLPSALAKPEPIRRDRLFGVRGPTESVMLEADAESSRAVGPCGGARARRGGQGSRGAVGAGAPE